MRSKPNVIRSFFRISAFLAVLGVAGLNQAFSTTGTSIDIPVATIGPYSDLTRNANWGVAGQGGIENSWIIQPLTPQTLTCIYIANNNPTNAHSFTLTFRSTGDPRVTSYLTQPPTGTLAAQQGKWNLVFSASGSVSSLGVATYSFGSQTSARAQIQITGTATAGGSPDTADIYIVQSTTSCGPATTNTVPIAVTVTSVTAPNVCGLSAVSIVATGTTATTVAAPGAGLFIHVCGYSVTSDTSQTTDPTDEVSSINFAVGTAGTCGALGTTKWSVAVHQGGSGSTSTTPMLSGGTAQVFQTTTANQPLCIQNVGAVVAARVSITYGIN